MEQKIYDAVWEALAEGKSKEEISTQVSLIDMDDLIEQCSMDFEDESLGG